MSELPRRSFLGLLAASASVAVSQARTLSAVGVQLYTLRNVLPQNPLEVLREVERIGYREVELTADDLERVYAAVKQTSLKPVSIHLTTALFTREQEKLPAALADAKRKGLEFAVCPYIAPEDRGGAAVMRKLGETLNKAGAICRDSGLRLCYHNHAFEFEPSGNGTLLDVLMNTVDPKLVSLELDIMWSRVAGVDPVTVLRKYAGRIPLMHLKNVAKGTEQRYNETVPKTAFREVGDGMIDIPAVLAAATQTGVEHFFVEQDQTPGDPLASLRASYRYVAGLNF
jgi:sugar phosphate isomerase/epimerase